MKVFYIEKDEFLNRIKLEDLEKYSDGKKYKSQEKYLEHLCGLYLVKNIAKLVYKLEDTEIEIRNSKPYFKSGDLFFSISHSKNIVAAGFYIKNIGTDIEYIKKRDYAQIMKRYNVENDNPTDFDFYKFWTCLEAEIKLGTQPVSRYTIPLEKDYVLSCVSDEILMSDFEIIKVQ